MVEYFLLYSSKDFRRSFVYLAEVHTFVLPCTPLMACTATASRSIKEEVIDSLEMSDYAEVPAASPDCLNIYYDIKCCIDIHTNFLPLITTLKKKAVNTARVLVYCQSLNL